MFASNNSLLPSPSAASARTRPVMDENVEDCDCSREDSVDDLIFSEVNILEIVIISAPLQLYFPAFIFLA